ncbi:MAG: PLP-dependent aminotransferase family protein [Actinomycetota bacterium]
MYRQLAAAITHLVRDGVLKDGDRLPPERALAEALNVSRGTIVTAYDELKANDTVSRVQGSGTTVTAPTPMFDPVSERRLGDTLIDPPARAIDLLMAVPSALPRVIEIVSRIDWAAHAASLDVPEPAGLPALRAAIADHTTAEGLHTTPEQVVVTAGAQQAISLTTELTVRPGDVVLTEQVTWPGLVDSVRRLGGRIHGVPMDDRGILPDELVGAIERLRPTLIGLNPHHHNPTGTRLSPERRVRVAEIAAEYGVPLIEDRVAAVLAFDGRIPPPLAVHQPGAAHFVVDSVNKTAWPGLRIGWVRTDAAVANRLRSARAHVDLYSPIPSQLAALAVLDDLEAITAERTAQLSHAAEVVGTLLAELLPDWEVPDVRGGMVSWVRLPEGSASAFAQVAARYGVAVGSGREFSSSFVDDEHIRIPFTAPIHALEEAIARLATAWAAFRHRPEQAAAVQPPRTAIV